MLAVFGHEGAEAEILRLAEGKPCRLSFNRARHRHCSPNHLKSAACPVARSITGTLETSITDQHSVYRVRLPEIAANSPTRSRSRERPIRSYHGRMIPYEFDRRARIEDCGCGSSFRCGEATRDAGRYFSQCASTGRWLHTTRRRSCRLPMERPRPYTYAPTRFSLPSLNEKYGSDGPERDRYVDHIENAGT